VWLPHDYYYYRVSLFFLSFFLNFAEVVGAANLYVQEDLAKFGYMGQRRLEETN
jgi:hypothetical protein